ncbi:outer membrane beta-barrel protein [Flavobacteriaceae bacterium Ap0902]|nr:outer membrane beta-barrel protein [Flavobacteriaceae bacterium Ap0902]
MKKLINVIFCLIAVYGTAQVTYGLKAGVNVSKIDEVHTGSEKRVGAYFGGFATIPINNEGNQFYIQPEVLYSMMGEKEEFTDGRTTDVNIDYLSIPVLFKAYFSEQDTEFFGEIGPQLGFLISKDLPETDAVYDYKSTDFGAVVGIGFSYLRNWEANARFYYGFTDIIEWENTKGKDPHNINSNVSLGIAYRF